MTVVVHDVHKEVDHSVMGHNGDCTSEWELHYAYDTMVMGSRATEFHIILKQIEIESERYKPQVQSL